MRTSMAALTCLACLIGRWSFAEVIPPQGTIDSRVRAVAYDAEQVYRLRGYIGFQIDLEFEAGESFLGLGAGDIGGLSYFAQDNHLFLKPKAANVATNLTVLTTRRHYQFEYAAFSERPNAQDSGVIYALRFVYAIAPAQAAAVAAARQIDTELDHASEQRRQNYDYWYCGSAGLRPVSVSDDGVHTRLRFAANADLPAIFVRNDDDSDSLLNYSMENGDVIVHRVAQRLILRRGKLKGCVVNKAFVGGGPRLDSGTIAPAVERTVQGVRP